MVITLIPIIPVLLYAAKTTGDDGDTTRYSATIWFRCVGIGIAATKTMSTDHDAARLEVSLLFSLRGE